MFQRILDQSKLGPEEVGPYLERHANWMEIIMDQWDSDHGKICVEETV